MSKLILSGDANVPAMPMTDAQVNHLRRLLAWVRLEYMLDEHMQRGYLTGVAEGVKHGIDPEHAQAVVQEAASRINHVPAYIRQGVKMLTKALAEHDKNSRILEQTK